MNFEIKMFTLGPLQNNSYLIWDREQNKGVVIDPTFDSETIVAFAKENGITIEKILNTHCHFDHISGNAIVAKYFKTKLFINKNDYELLKQGASAAEYFGLDLEPSPEPDGFLNEGDKIEFGKCYLNVIETPGHTRGGICFYSDLCLFSGDTLFEGSIGRTDLEGGDFDAIVKSIRSKLFSLDPKTKVYPGHGGLTTIGREVGDNPFLNGEIK